MYLRNEQIKTRMTKLLTGKEEIISDLEKRVDDKILERNNFDLLKKLIGDAGTLDEAIKIAELGTTYKRTGFHFDKRLERQSNTITFFKKNDALSFDTDPDGITHKLIIGDNYPALLNLLIEYKGRIDVIYIDPPYGKDSMGNFAETNYDNAITRDNLLSMLYPRLYLAKQLLSERGVIFCSIDDKNQAYVKCLFDEVFNESNFVGTIIWNSTKSVTNTALISVSHTYNLVYFKDIDYYTTNRTEFRLPDEGEGFENPDNDPRGAWKGDPFQVGGWRPNQQYTITNPKTGVEYRPNPGSSWKNEYEKFLELLNDNRIVFGKTGEGGPLRKRFIWEAEERGKVAKTIWDATNTVWGDVGTTTNGTQLVKQIFDGVSMFDNPKPVDLIIKILQLGSTDDSIVLDFFAGSGTTGHAVLELNHKANSRRQFIGVQLNEDLDMALKNAPQSQTLKNQIELCAEYNRPHRLSEVTVERLRRVMTGRCYDGTNDFKWATQNKPLGGNLLVLDIDDVSNREAVAGKTAFDVIDETLYGKEKFKTVREKVEWVCNNFEVTQKRLEEE